MTKVGTGASIRMPFPARIEQPDCAAMGVEHARTIAKPFRCAYPRAS